MFVCEYIFLTNFKPYLDGREEGWDPSLPEPPRAKGLSIATSKEQETSPRKLAWPDAWIHQTEGQLKGA